MNKIFLAALLAISISVLLGSNQDAYAVQGTISNQASCEEKGGAWTNPNICTVTSMTVDGGTLQISSGIILQNDGTITIEPGATLKINPGGTINNSGTIINKAFGYIRIEQGSTFNNLSGGTINNSGNFENETLGPIGGTFNNSGTFNNLSGGIINNTPNSTIINFSGGTINNNSGGIINNVGTFNNSDGALSNSGTINNLSGAVIINSGTINNSGIINNHCGAVYSGNTPIGNPLVPLCEDIDLTCGPNTYESDGQCLPVSGLAFCGDKTNNVAGFCIPDLTQICGDGTIISDMMCIVSSIDETVAGVLLEINSVSLLVGAIGVNPVFTGLIGITIAGVVGQAVWFVHKRKSKK